MREILEHSTSFPSCIFAENDSMAIGVIKALHEKDYNIPEDLSIMGFDDIAYSKIIHPGLTTMRIPLKTIGALAVQRLNRRMQTQKSNDVKIEIGAKLVIRGSTAPPKAL